MILGLDLAQMSRRIGGGSSYLICITIRFLSEGLSKRKDFGISEIAFKINDIELRRTEYSWARLTSRVKRTGGSGLKLRF
jgi:hypothetical protein